MTQPVQEPTTQRVVSKLGWGERQLERRPGPTSGVISVFRALMDNGISPIGDFDTFIDFNNWEGTYDSSIFQPLEAGLVNSTTYVRYVRLLRPGRYSFQCSINLYASSPAGQPDGTVTLAFYDNNIIFGEYQTFGHAPDPGSDLAGMISGHWAYTYPPYDPFSSGAPTDGYLATFLVSTDSTVDLTAEGAEMEINYWPMDLPGDMI